MFESRFLAGIVAGLPISLLCVGYVLARRAAVVATMLDGADGATLSASAATALMAPLSLPIQMVRASRCGSQAVRSYAAESKALMISIF